MKARFFFVFKWLCLPVLGCLIYGFLIEPRLMKTRHYIIQSDNFSGQDLRIAALSDIHIGSPHVSAKRVKKIVAAINQQKPDIILITGDFIGGHVKQSERSDEFNTEIQRGMQHLSGLHAPLGTFSSLGNHDAWYGKTTVRTMLEAAEITVLDNAGSDVEDRICIVGLADFDTDSVDARSFDDCTENRPIIVITHSPDSFQYLRSDTAFALAGHTHGGQINLPLLGRAVTSTRAGKKYAYGLVSVGSMPAFVTAGIGTSILPARFRSPPEIVIITLSSRN